MAYASTDNDASFQCGDNLVYIHNSIGRLSAYIGWTIAAFLIVFPLVRTLVPGTTWFAFDEAGGAGWFGLLVYVFVIFVCIAGGFWWSTIRADLATGQVERRSRWGPFTTHTVVPLTAFKEVRLARRSDGDTTVDLVGSQRMRIVWGRSRRESVRIASEFAARVAMPVVGEEDEDAEAEAG